MTRRGMIGQSSLDYEIYDVVEDLTHDYLSDIAEILTLYRTVNRDHKGRQWVVLDAGGTKFEVACMDLCRGDKYADQYNYKGKKGGIIAWLKADMTKIEQELLRATNSDLGPEGYTQDVICKAIDLVMLAELLNYFLDVRF